MTLSQRIEGVKNDEKASLSTEDSARMFNIESEDNDIKFDATVNGKMTSEVSVNGLLKKHEKFETSEEKTRPRPLLPLTISLPILVAIDMFGVSLVVPLLHQYYQLAGVSSAKQREWLSSLFSFSQILGGIALGALSDCNLVGRRSTLLLSFLGSSVAYYLLALGNIKSMVISRVLVGFVKQTMTVSTAILARHTKKEERATQMGRLSASVTVAWIAGPSAGGFLYKHVGHFAPVTLACLLFIVNILIALFVLPEDGEQAGETGYLSETKDYQDHAQTDKKDVTKKSSSSFSLKLSFLISNFKSCFGSSRCLTAVVAAELIFLWVTRTTSYKNIATYYEQRYGMEPYQRGYLQSYQMALSFVAQSLLVRPVLRLAGGEVNAVCLSAAIMAMATFSETLASFYTFILLLCPVIATTVAIMGTSLKSAVTQVAPKNALGSVFAGIDVLQNAAAVTVPFYRTVLFSVTRSGSDVNGDPDPTLWLLSSGVHWLLASCAMCCLLLRGQPCSGIVGSTIVNGAESTVDIEEKETCDRKLKTS